MLRIDVISVQPEMLSGFFAHSILARAAKKGLVEISLVDLKRFGVGRWRKTDAPPYGGGPGLLMRCEPWFAAVESCASRDGEERRVIMTSPAGALFTQKTAQAFAEKACARPCHLVFMCGHYEGFDARIETLATDFFSIGDVVLTGGELAAGVMVDAIVRLLPGALGGGAEAVRDESFGAAGLLEAPQWTKPAVFRGLRVPDVLLSGDHAKVEAFNKAGALARTRARRPDLCEGRA